MINERRKPSYCPFCGGGSFTVGTDRNGSIVWIMCLSCGWDSNVYGGDIAKWGRTSPQCKNPDGVEQQDV